MRYQFIGDKLELINYKISYTETEESFDENENSEGNTMERELLVTTDEILERIKSDLENQEISYKVEKIDNNGYEWLDSQIFTNTERLSKYVEKAIELGEQGYNDFYSQTNTDSLMQSLQDQLVETQLMLAMSM